MSTAYEYAERAIELCDQDLNKAVSQYRKAMDLYRREHDFAGVAFVLGRLGDCYERHGRDEEAIAVYREAVALKTDIPATYHQLIALLVDMGDLSSAFEVAEDWKRYGGQQVYGSPYRIFADLGNSLARGDQFDEAIDLLLQAIVRLERETDVEGYWMARGYLGQAYERAGRLDEAAATYSAAIDAGSPDQLTFTRYLIYLEKQRRYDDALRLIKTGLRVQHNAAWELDLRKRQQRIEQKAGKAPKTNKEVLPIYSIRQGKDAVALLHQVKSSPQINAVSVAGDMALAISGGKTPKLTAYELEAGSVAWSSVLLEAVQGVQATQNAIVTYAKNGPVGVGSTKLRFWNRDGAEIAAQELPAVTSEVCAFEDQVFVGCRDGMLYAFSETGERLWTHRVPGSEGKHDNPYMRPCPYLLRVARDVVAYSSFENLVLLSRAGKPKWTWSVAERVLSTRTGGITIEVSMGANSISDFALARETGRVLVAAGQSVYEVQNGSTVHEIRRSDQYMGGVAVSPDGDFWAYGAGEHLYLVQNRSPVRSLAAFEHPSLLLDMPAERLIAWSDRQLLITDLHGKGIAQLEFAKGISDVFGLGDGRLVIGAGYLVILDTRARSVTSKGSPTRSVENPKLSTSHAEIDISSLPKEERGFSLRWFVGRKLSSAGKASYEGEGGQSMTIEQYALQAYNRLGYTGSWTENDYWWTIMALLFWDVIYARLPGVFTPAFGDFPSQLQDMPNDFFSEEFYARRRQLIERRVDELTKSRLFGLRRPSIEQELRTSFRQNFGKPCRAANWQRWNRVDELAVALQVLTDMQVLQIMQRLLVSFNDNRSGLPDLFLTKDGAVLFAEVKSKTEQVAEHQWAWMRYLRDEMKCSVEVCRVVNQ